MFLPRISNEVFEDELSAKNVELKKFDLHFDTQFAYFFNKSFDAINYDATRYQNEQAHSPIFKQHLECVIGYCKDNFSISTDVVEVGCGKGTFLNLLSEHGFTKLRGFDQTYQGLDPRIVKDYLSERFSPLLADVIVMRHVLEHIPDPIRFLGDLEQLNGKPLKFVIEVPSMDWNIRARAYWDFGYEHTNYFTIASFNKIFEDCKIFEVFDRQYLLVIADSSYLVKRVLNESQPSDVFEKILVAGLANNPITQFARSGGRYWVWGAGGKGVLLMFHLMKNWLSEIYPPLGMVDINPAKQDNFIAYSGVPIVSPRIFFDNVRENDVIFIANPNYEDEISGFVSEHCTVQVKFIAI